MAQYDGSIRINTQINTQNASAQLMSLENRIVKTADKIASLRSKMDALKGTKVPTQEYEKLQNDISKATAKLEQLKAQQASLKSSGKMFSDDWKSLSEQSQEAALNIRNIKQEMESLKNSGSAMKEVPTEEYAELERKLQSSKNFLSRFVEEQNKLKSEGKEYTEEWKELSRYIEHQSSLIKEIEQKMQSLKDSGKAMKEVPTEEYSQLQNQLQKWQANARSIEAEQEKLRQSGKQFTNEWNNSANRIREARAQISSINTAMRALEQEGKAFTAGEETEEYARLSQQLQYAENDMRVLNQRHQELENRQARNANGYRRLGRSARDGAKKANKSVKGMSDTLKMGFKNILKYGLGIRSLYALVNKIRTAIKEGFSNFSDYSNEFKNAVNSLKGSTLTLKNAFAAAFAPLVEMAIPYIQRVVEWLTKLMDIIGQFVAAVKGQKNYTKAIKQTTGAIEDQNKAQNKQLSGLDKLNNLTSSSGGGADGGVGDMFEEAPIDDSMIDAVDRLKDALKPMLDYSKKLKDIFMQGFWDGLGDWEYRLESIKDSLKSIKDSLIDIWTDPKVLTAADRWAQSVAYLLGSIVGSMASIGLTIAANLLGGIAKYLEQNKDRIKKYLISIFDIWAEINYLFAGFFQSLAYVFEAFASEQGQQLTANIIGIFTNAFMGITELSSKFFRDLAQLIIKPFVDNKEALKTALEGFLSVLAEVMGTIKQGIDETFDKLNEVYDAHFKPFFDSVAQGLSDLVGKFLEFWNGTVQPILMQWAADFDALWTAHIQPLLNNVANFLGKIMDLLRVLWENVLQPFVSWIIANVLPKILPVIQALWNFVKDFVAYIADRANAIITILGGIIDFLTGVFTGNWELAFQGLQDIVTGFIDFVRNLIEGFITLVVDILAVFFENIKAKIEIFIQAVTDLTQKFLELIQTRIIGKFDEIRNGFSNFLSGVNQAWNDGWNALFNKVNEIVSSIKNAIQNAFEWISSKVEGIKNLLGGVANAVSGAFSGGGGVTTYSSVMSYSAMPQMAALSKMEFPGYATGQVIPTSMKKHLAWLGDNKHETEVVSPLSTIEEAVENAMERAGGMGARKVTIEIPLVVDGRELTRVVQDYDLQAYGRRGKGLFEH